MTRNEYKEWLQQLLLNNPEIQEGTTHEMIYLLDDIHIYGNFEQGSRGVDHNIIHNSHITWEQILLYGTLVIPETKIYIGGSYINMFENIGYDRLPLDSNHIVGYKAQEDLEQGSNDNEPLRDFY